MNSTNFETVDVGDVPFASTTMDEAVAWTVSAANSHLATSIRLANAYCVALAHRDTEYRDLLANSGLNFADGTPIVWVQRRKGSPQSGRVRGPSFFERVIDEGQRAGLRHFFLGSSDNVLRELQARLSRRYPQLIVAGTFSPNYEPLSEEFHSACEQAVLPSKADIVWVGLGTPKQDFVAAALSARLGIPCAGVGAAFDFSAGKVREAPRWIQRSGFEWLFRLATEPRRLWRRYLVGNLRFVVAVIKPQPK